MLLERRGGGARELLLVQEKAKDTTAPKVPNSPVWHHQSTFGLLSHMAWLESQASHDALHRMAYGAFDLLPPPIFSFL